MLKIYQIIKYHLQNKKLKKCFQKNDFLLLSLHKDIIYIQFQ